MISQSCADEGGVSSSAALSVPCSDAGAGQATAAEPGQEDTLMVCNPLFGNADVGRSSALQRVAVAEDLPPQPPVADQAGAPSQTGWQPYPAEAAASSLGHADALTSPQQQGMDGLSAEQPREGATSERAGSSFWGVAGDGLGAEEVSLVSSPRGSATREQAEACVTNQAAGHPDAGASFGGSPGAGSGAAPAIGAGALPEARSLTAPAPDNPWAAAAAAPDQASVTGGPTQQQRGRLTAQQPEQAPVPSSCASNRPFFPPASRYGGAVGSVPGLARGECVASASALPCQAEGASGQGDQRGPVQEAARQRDAAEPVQASGEASAGTRAGTVVVRRREAAVGAEARAAWGALRQAPREGGAAQGQTRSPLSGQPMPRDVPMATTKQLEVEGLPAQRRAEMGGAGTPSGEALLRRLVSARQGPLAACSTAVLRASLHSAPEQAPHEAAPVLTWRSDPAHRREPSTMAFLRHSGVFPTQGPLGASRELLLRSAALQLPVAGLARPAAAGLAGAHARAADGDASGQNRQQREVRAGLAAAAAVAEPEQAEWPRRDAAQLPGGCASPAQRPQLCPPPQHLRTPTLMQRAGELLPPHVPLCGEPYKVQWIAFHCAQGRGALQTAKHAN